MYPPSFPDYHTALPRVTKIIKDGDVVKKAFFVHVQCEITGLEQRGIFEIDKRILLQSAIFRGSRYIEEKKIIILKTGALVRSNST